MSGDTVASPVTATGAVIVVVVHIEIEHVAVGHVAEAFEIVGLSDHAIHALTTSHVGEVVVHRLGVDHVMILHSNHGTMQGLGLS